jgi:hypothetical protein
VCARACARLSSDIARSHPNCPTWKRIKLAAQQWAVRVRRPRCDRCPQEKRGRLALNAIDFKEIRLSCHINEQGECSSPHKPNEGLKNDGLQLPQRNLAGHF